MHRRQQHDLIDLAAFYHPHWRNDAQNKQINKQTEKKKRKEKKKKNSSESKPIGSDSNHFERSLKKRNGK